MQCSVSEDHHVQARLKAINHGIVKPSQSLDEPELGFEAEAGAKH